jgi:hypothetical protein
MAPLPRSPGDVFDDVVSGFIPHIDAKGERYESSRQRREDERHCHHLQVGKAAGGKQRKIIHDTLPSRGKRREPLAWCGSGGSS